MSEKDESLSCLGFESQHGLEPSLGEGSMERCFDQMTRIGGGFLGEVFCAVEAGDLQSS